MQVPEHSAFPKDAKLLLGWRLWVGGQVGYEYLNKAGTDQLAPVRPFRILKKKMLPKEVRKKFSLSWEPISQMMEQADGMNLDDDPIESFKIGYKYLKTRVWYVFQGKRMKLDTWRVSYWQLKVQRGSTMKHGKEGNKEKLPEATKRY